VSAGTLILAVSNDPMPIDHDGDGWTGIYSTSSVAAVLARLPTYEWVDVHGNDARRLDVALTALGVAVRREERHDPLDRYPPGAWTRWVVRYWGGGGA
jgi:hypothetical protein